MSKPATAQQLAIVEAVTSNPKANVVVEALAGTGKTSTIVDYLLPRLTGQSLLLAYNKSIQRELTSRIPAALAFAAIVGTVHSFGLGAYRRHQRSVKVEGGKLHFIMRNILDSKPSFRSRFNERQAGRSSVVQLASHAKNNGIGLSMRAPIADEQAWLDLLDHFNMEDDFLDAGISLTHAVEMAQLLLVESNKATGSVDFDDMIYLPLLFDLPIQQFQNVIIDEAQDISFTRFELARRACVDFGRMIAVGDRHQAIYGFTGADAQAMDNIIHRLKATVLPLTTCWRCDAEIIREAQAFVPAIQARPNAPEGSISSIDIYSMLEQEIPLGSAILCRLNRPNVALALEMMRQGKPCKIEGRDLGRSLLEHMKKAQPLYATGTLFELIEGLEEYKERQQSALFAKNKPSQAAFLGDEVDGALLIVERCVETGGDRWANVEALINSLFADDIPSKNIITLSSVHKAKGREWPTVFILGREDYMPFQMAKMDWEIEQEDNLIYVATTRAEHSLIHVNGVKDWLDDRAK